MVAENQENNATLTQIALAQENAMLENLGKNTVPDNLPGFFQLNKSL